MHKQEKFWNKVARMSKPVPDAAARKVIDLTKAHLQSTHHVLDVGCGTGTITVALAGSCASITAIDIAEGMLHKAWELTKEQGVENVDFIRAILFDSQLKEQSFDVIMAFNILHYIEDLPTFVNRVHALLKPGGQFISSTACIQEKRGGVRALMTILNGLRIVPKTNFFRKSDLTNPMENAGLRITHSERISKMPEWYFVAEKKV